MNMKVMALAACFGMQSLVANAEYREFTDATGRKLEAELIRYDASSKKVSLNCKGKGSKTVSISIFSEADQKYIISWNKNQNFLSDQKLKVEFNRRKSKNTDYTSEYYSMSRKYYDCSYKITVKNNSTADFDDVTLEYVVFYTQDKHIHNNRDIEEQHGTLYAKKKISLPKKSTHEFETEQLLIYTYRESGYDYNWPDIQSEIDGIILNLSMKSGTGKTISRRIKYPDKLLLSWTTQTKNVQRRPSN